MATLAPLPPAIPMIVSWNWLKEYLPLNMSHAEATERLLMAGLNHESTTPVADDLAIDLEVTSNRPDCNGHIGVAREISVLFDEPLQLPPAAPKATGGDVNNFARVRVAAPDLCLRYTARLISGVKVGPSPDWLVKRLATVYSHKEKWKPVNNVVDITNYVLLECAQPLHAFDYRKLAGREIIVRRAKPGESLEALDHNIYKLDPEMCVIADSEAPVAIAGVMGGASSEVTTKTTEILIESAEFAPLAVRRTARQLKLHSDSSYRFERGVDPLGVEWASRRCCELILEICGGELCAGVIDIGGEPAPRAPIVLRLAQIQRVLGIEVPPSEVRRILLALGLTEPVVDAPAVTPAKAARPLPVPEPPVSLTLTPPSWRRDLSREIDLIEEVARIHGYDKIPEDASVPMTSSHRTDWERVHDTAGSVLCACGFDEAMTTSVVPAAWNEAFSPWCDAPALVTGQPMLEGADRVRRSIVPSLLAARQQNEAQQNEAIELFETSRIYFPSPTGLPTEQWSLALTSGRGYLFVKGVLEALLSALGIGHALTAEPQPGSLLDSSRSARLLLDGELLGFLGEVSPVGKKAFGLRGAATVAEIDLRLLLARANMIPQHADFSNFPPMSRDLNLIVDEAVRWSDLEATVRASAGELLEAVRYAETYRDAQKDGPGKKRLLFSLALRSRARTLTGEEADAARDAVVSACQAKHGAVLLA